MNRGSNLLMGLALIAASMPGCGESLANLTASLGGIRAGGRGSVRVLFINNTTLTPVFTYGTYDQTNQDSQPDFAQFVADEEAGEVILPNEASGVSTLACGRVFSIGSSGLLDRIETNPSGSQGDETAFIEGIEFVDFTDPLAPLSRGRGPQFEALLGVDFPCGALLIVRLERDEEADSFLIDFEMIPPQSTR